MNSKIIDKSNKFIYRKLDIKKIQLNTSSNKNNKNQKLFENKRKTEYIPNYSKSNSHLNFFNETQLKNNIKSMQVQKQRKRQNLFIKNKLKDKESLNMNVNINKIINKKDNPSIKGFDMAFSSISDPNKNHKSNNDNIKSTNFLIDKDKNSDIKKTRFDSDISNSNNTKISKINNITIKNYNNKNKQNKLNQKNDINLYNIYNKATKINIKSKKTNSNFIENKINNILEHEININNLIKVNNSNIKIKNKYSKDINHKNININKIKAMNEKKRKIIKTEKTKANAIQNNKEEFHLTNNINLNKNKENIIDEKNLYPVKKSLFSEHMNFLLNFNNENNFNNEKNNIINNTNNKNYNYYINNPLNSKLQSTENKEFESKFINYDLGKTTGTSQIKDSLIVFGNDDTIKNNEISKVNNLSKNQNYFGEEKERTRDELEKLAEQFLNISKINEYTKNRNQIDNSQTNTITTIIYNNIND